LADEFVKSYDAITLQKKIKDLERVNPSGAEKIAAFLKKLNQVKEV